MRCARCDTELPAGAKFCLECGQPVDSGASKPDRTPRDYTPKHLADKILQSKSALEGERYLYAIRLPANAVLHREIEPLLTRPVGRPSNRPVVWHHDFLYQASTWDRPRRVVAKIEHHKGELFPRVGFIVTNLRRPSWRVVKFYNGRGTAEQWIKEGKNAVK
jgi:hypothetical protein